MNMDITSFVSVTFYILTNSLLSLGEESFIENTLLNDEFDVLYSSSNTTGPDIERTCDAFLSAFAQQSSLFTKCLIENARPFRLCESCVTPYKTSSSIFSDLNADTNCYKQIVMADRVQVVRLVHDNMQGVWKSGNCDGCFSSITEDNVNGTVNSTLTNSTLLFLSLFKNITSCLNTTIQDVNPTIDGNSSFCDKCKLYYHELNDHFSDMMEKSSSQVCMDVVDMMNYTRLMWSKTYNCSHRMGDTGPIYAISVIVCALPVIFYVVNRFTGQRTERTLVVQKRMKFSTRSSQYGSMQASLNNHASTTNTQINT